jgi:hypothetical protein
MGRKAREKARRKAEARVHGTAPATAAPHEPSVLLVTWGIPGVGKTTFANWLVKEKGFKRVDSDYPNPASALDQWWLSLRARKVTVPAFVAEMRRRGPVVLEFGMYAGEGGVNAIAQLVAAGAIAWWFDGDRDEAFRAWSRDALGRGMALAKWEEVVSVIRGNWSMIQRFFDSHIVRTIEAGPVHVPPEDTYRAIFGSGHS